MKNKFLSVLHKYIDKKKCEIFQDRVSLKSYNSVWAREMAQCIKELVL